MKQSACFHRMWVVAILLATLVVAFTTGTLVQAEGNPNPRILPPDSTPFGLTYSQWNVRWWQWALGQPTATNPLLDKTGAFCAAGQKGKVWFLAGTFPNDQPGSGSAVRTCSVPTGKALFLPVANAIYIADPGQTAEDAQQLAKQTVDSANALAAEIDGVAVQDLNRYRIQPPLPIFQVTFPMDNIFGLPPDLVEIYDHQPASADGYYLMLAPLSRGTHEIHIHAAFPGLDPIDVTYYLTVRRAP